MPIVNFVLQGDLSEQVIKLDKSKKVAGMKLLHIYHNINSKLFSTTIDRADGVADKHIRGHQRFIFARLSFVNSDNSQTYFTKNNGLVGVNNPVSDNLICFGLTKHSADPLYQFKDLYKVLVDDIPKTIDQAITIKLYTLTSGGAITPLHPADFIPKENTEHTNMILTFEIIEA